MKIYGAISTFLFGTSIYFYNGINGVIVSIISFFTKILSFYIKEKYIKYIKYFSFIIPLLYFFIFTKNNYEILPAISLVFIILADFQNEILKMKYYYYGSNISWLIYSILLNSLPGILYDIFGFIILTYSIYKIKIKLNH